MPKIASSCAFVWLVLCDISLFRAPSFHSLFFFKLAVCFCEACIVAEIWCLAELISLKYLIL